jgi:hypothetical protein
LLNTLLTYLYIDAKTCCNVPSGTSKADRAMVIKRSFSADSRIRFLQKLHRNVTAAVSVAT